MNGSVFKSQTVRLVCSIIAMFVLMFVPGKVAAKAELVSVSENAVAAETAAAATCKITFHAGENGQFQEKLRLQIKSTVAGTVVTSGEGTDSVICDVDKGRTILLGAGEESALVHAEPGKIFLGWSNTSDGSQLYTGGYEYVVTKDTEFTAVWGDPYTVTFNANGGTIEDQARISQKYAPGTVIGYNGSTCFTDAKWADDSKIFAGWSLAQDGSGTVYSNRNAYTVKGNVTLYAVWKDTVRLRFVIEKGKASRSVTGQAAPEEVTEFDTYVEKGSYYNLYPYNETWNGYTIKASKGNNIAFAGWNTTLNAKDILYGITAERNTTLYVVWKQAFDVTLDLNGGKYKNSTDAVVVERKLEGSSLLSVAGSYSYALAPPQGMLFFGWSKTVDASGGLITYEDKLDADTTLYAVYRPKKSVTYDANGGYFSGNVSTEKRDFPQGQSLNYYYATPPAINNDHLAFAGWSLTKNGDVLSDMNTMKVESDMTLYAVWKKAYLITFLANGGSLSYYDAEKGTGDLVSSTTRKVLEGKSFIESNAWIPSAYSTKRNYGFHCWVTDEGKRKDALSSFIPGRDMTITAAWLPVVTVTYDGNGRNLAKDTPDFSHKYIMGRITLSHPVVDGFKVVEWSTTADGRNVINEDTFEAKSDITLYAVWKKVVSVTVHANEGKLASYWGASIYRDEQEELSKMFAGSYYTDKPMEYVGNTAVRDGYAFAGWSTSEAGETVDLSSFTPAEDTDLYASWTDQYFTVTFKGLLYGEYRVPKNGSLVYFARWCHYFDRPTQKFIGFSETEDGDVVNINTYRVNQDVTLYTVFEEKEFEQDSEEFGNTDTTLPQTDDEAAQKAEQLVKIAEDEELLDLTGFRIPSDSDLRIQDVTKVKDQNALYSLKDVVCKVITAAKETGTTVQALKLFDLNAKGKGQIGIYIGKSFTGLYVVVGHYHAGDWSIQQCEVDTNGYIYPNFVTFSPICIGVTTSPNRLTNVRTTEEGVSFAHTHRYDSKWTIDRKATFTEDGKKSKHCKECLERSSVTVIPKVAQVKFAQEILTYNGKDRKPKLVIKDSTGKSLKENTDYTLTLPKNRKEIGAYTATLTLKGDYSGSRTLKFYIGPKNASGLRLSARKKGIKVTWRKQTKQTDGYEISYSLKKNFAKAKTETIQNNKATWVVLKGLRSKKSTYYVRIRSYKKIREKKYYSVWSKTKKIVLNGKQGK